MAGFRTRSMYSAQTKPTPEQQAQASLGYRAPEIDGRNWVNVGARVYKCSARPGSMATKEAHAITPHPSNRRRVICWLFLAMILSCSGYSLVALFAPQVFA